MSTVMHSRLFCDKALSQPVLSQVDLTSTDSAQPIYRKKRILFTIDEATSISDLLLKETIKVFVLQQSTFNLKHVDQMQFALMINHSLVELDLGSNQLGCDATVRLVDSLHNHPALQRLNLHGNVIRDKGMDAIVTLLSKNQVLVELDISRNRFSQVAVIALARVLCLNTSLAILKLNDNRCFIPFMGATVAVGLSMDAVKQLAAMLQVNRSLRVLSLNGNNLQAEHMSELMNALHHNAVLTNLYVMGTHLTATIHAHLETLVQKNASLTALHISRAVGSGRQVGPLPIWQLTLSQRRKNFVANLHRQLDDFEAAVGALSDDATACQAIVDAFSAKLFHLNHLPYLAVTRKQAILNRFHLLQMKYVIKLGDHRKMAALYVSVPDMTATLNFEIASYLYAYTAQLFSNPIEGYLTVCAFLQDDVDSASVALMMHALISVLLYVQDPQACKYVGVDYALQMGFGLPLSLAELTRWMQQAIVALGHMQLLDEGSRELLDGVVDDLGFLSPAQLLTLCQLPYIKEWLEFSYGSSLITTLEHVMRYPREYPIRPEPLHPLTSLQSDIAARKLQVATLKALDQSGSMRFDTVREYKDAFLKSNRTAIPLITLHARAMNAHATAESGEEMHQTKRQRVA